jgi:F-type H+-transporting ATPase subunit delta
MGPRGKQIQQLARLLFRLSVVDGTISPERVAGVLDYVAAHRPANPVSVLRAYHRLVAASLARSRAVVEHAGTVSDGTLQTISAAMSRRYGRPVSAVALPDPGLVAGLRVRVGDDVYESSIAAQLAQLAGAV